MTYVRGVDVSHWQAPGPGLDSKVTSFGARFAFVKASQGARSRDPRLFDHLDRFARLGLDRGAYHFYDFGVSAKANADNFVAALRPHRLELRPVLDAEHGSAGSRVATANVLLEFLRRVEHEAGARPIVYTYAAWWNATVAPVDEFAIYPLWIARYPSRFAGGTVPGSADWTDPAHPWRSATAWQFSTYAGLDRNVVGASRYAELLARSTPNPPTSTGGTLIMDTEAKAAFDRLEAKLSTLLESTPKKAAPVRGPDGKVWIITEAGRWHVPDAETLDSLIYIGQVHGYGSAGVAKVTEDFLDGIPVLAALK